METNGIDRRGGENLTLTEEPIGVELEEGRSPVEEAGHEVEGVEDEELGSTVEEGEEAALALDASPTQTELQWLSDKQDSVNHSEVGHLLCETQDNESNNELEESSLSLPQSQPTEVSSKGEWGIHCPSAHSDTCHSNNLA